MGKTTNSGYYRSQYSIGYYMSTTSQLCSFYNEQIYRFSCHFLFLTNLFFFLRFVTCNLCKIKYKKITELLYDLYSVALLLELNDCL